MKADLTSFNHSHNVNTRRTEYSCSEWTSDHGSCQVKKSYGISEQFEFWTDLIKEQFEYKQMMRERAKLATRV